MLQCREMLFIHHCGHDHHHMRLLKMFHNDTNHQRFERSKAQHFFNADPYVEVPIPSVYVSSQHLLALYLNWGAATQSPERLVEPFSRMPKNGGALTKTRAFLGKVEEIVARAPIYKFNILFARSGEFTPSPCIVE